RRRIGKANEEPGVDGARRAPVSHDRGHDLGEKPVVQRACGLEPRVQPLGPGRASAGPRARAKIGLCLAKAPLTWRSSYGALGRGLRGLGGNEGDNELVGEATTLATDAGALGRGEDLLQRALSLASEQRRGRLEADHAVEIDEGDPIAVGQRYVAGQRARLTN